MKRNQLLALALLLGAAAIVATLAFFLLRDDPDRFVERRDAARSSEAGPQDVDPASASTSKERGATEAAPTRVVAADAETSAAGTDTDAASGDLVAIHGRVIDEQRRPVADALVELRFEQKALRSTRTDARGRFTLRTEPAFRGEWRRGSVLARDDRGRAGLRRFDLWFDFAADQGQPARRNEVEPIVVRAAGNLRVRVVGAAGPVAGATVAVESGEERLPAANASTDDSGCLEVAQVPAGTATILVRAASHGFGRAGVEVPAGVTLETEIPLLAPRSVDVLVTERSSGAPIARARVELHEAVPYLDPATIYSIRRTRPARTDPGGAPTDAAGRTRIEVEPGVDWSVHVAADGFVDAWSDPLASTLPLKPDAAELHLILAMPLTNELRWRLPADARLTEGDELEIIHTTSGRDGPKVGRVANGCLVVEARERGPGFVATAVTADERLAALDGRLALDAGRAEALVFVPARTLEVSVVDPAGRPRAGLPVGTTSESREGRNRTTFHLLARTGPDGIARFQRLFPEKRRVVVAPEPEAGQISLDAGSVDLTNEDGRVTFTLAEPYEAILQFTLDGERRLPHDLRLAWASDLASRRVEDPERGDIHCWFVASGGRPNYAYVQVPGFVDRNVSIPLPEGTEPVVVPVELGRGATLTLRIVKRSDVVVRPTLQVWNEPRQKFEAVPGSMSNIQDPNQVDGTYRFTSLAAGRYRVLEEVTKATSDEVAIADGGGSYELTFGLSQIVHVAGRVEAPAGESLGFVRLFAFDESIAPDWQPGQPQPKGYLDLPVANGRFEGSLGIAPAWRLVAVHSWLELEEGSLRITESRDDLVLRLVETPTVRFRASFAVDVGPFDVGVSLYARGGERRRPVAWHGSAQRGDVRVFPARPFGTFDVLLTAMRNGPVWIEGVTLDGTAKDLGDIVFPRGSQVTLRLRSRSGAPAPAIRAYAFRTEAPPCFAQTAPPQSGGAVAELPRLEGLLAGRYRLTVTTERGQPVGGTEPVEFEVDGVHDREVEVAIE